MFSKLLIANRGEIACRIIRSARRLGIRTVAVFSDADRGALHVQLADEAVHIGPAPARDSYLDAARIITAATRTGATAVHPGYGFLSENAAFARACSAAGITFVGPPAAAIEAMGSKAAAKTIMERAGVPLLPGYHGEEQAPGRLREAAQQMGYPVLLKATAGGGGKGMRVVPADEQFEESLASAQREAQASFGDARMLVEKYLEGPRHVEIQVFCDQHGHGVYLGERDCSLQRRHQKVIEEAPAPGLDEPLRTAMGEAAVTAARAIDYCGAGTVEFLLDRDGRFYFMEMNTRLQVEHPVTEMISGQDLVEWQLRVAAGEPLPLAQREIRLCGHAIEARIYAEDADNDFLPVTGRLGFLRTPEESRHVRIDTGVREGDEISVHYDPMIAKLITWDETRDRALLRMQRALSDYRIGGTVTNLGFLYSLVSCPAFARADLDTHFIERYRETLFQRPAPDRQRDAALAAIAFWLWQTGQGKAPPASDPWSPWHTLDGWRLNEPHLQRIDLYCHGEAWHVTLELRAQSGFRVWAVSAAEGSDEAGADARSAAQVPGGDALPELHAELHGELLQVEQAGHRQRATLAQHADGFSLYLDERALDFHPLAPDLGDAGSGTGAGSVRAPMNGTIVSLLAHPGTQVQAGQPLLIMEAMKMEHTLRAPLAGTLLRYRCSEGELVDGGSELLELEPADATAEERG